MRNILLIIMVFGLVTVMGATNHTFKNNEIESLRMGIKSDNIGLSESASKMAVKYEIPELQDDVKKAKKRHANWEKELEMALKELDKIQLDGKLKIHINQPEGVADIDIDLSELRVELQKLKEYLQSDEFKIQLKEIQKHKVIVHKETE